MCIRPCVLVILFAVAFSAEPPTTKADLAATMDLATSLLLPEGVEAVHGVVKWTYTGANTGNPPDLPSSSSTQSSITSELMTVTGETSGLHLRHRDGSIAINGRHQLPTGLMVTAATVTPVTIADLQLADAEEMELPPGLEAHPMAAMMRQHQQAQRWAPVHARLGLHYGNDLLLLALVAWRLGQRDVDSLVLAMPGEPSTNALVDPLQLHLPRRPRSDGSMVVHSFGYSLLGLDQPDQATTVGLIVHRRLRQLWLNESQSERRQQIAEAAVAVLPELHRTEAAALIQRLHVAQSLPESAGPGSDLATKLASLATPAPERGSGFWIGDSDETEAPATVLIPGSDGLQIRIDDPAWGQAALSPIAELMALLGDERPSRWRDGDTPHCVGDAALRALGLRLGLDPRHLVPAPQTDDTAIAAMVAMGMDPENAAQVLVMQRAQGQDSAWFNFIPWTDAERQRAAQALASWWASRQGQGEAELIVDLASSLEVTIATELALNRVDSLRPRLLHAVIGRLDHLPSSLDAAACAELLAAAAGDDALATRVDSWPLQGPQIGHLVDWHDRRGHSERGDAVLDQWLRQPAVNQADQHLHLMNSTNPLSQLLERPNPARLQLVIAAAQSAPSETTLWRLLEAAVQGGNAMHHGFLPSPRALAPGARTEALGLATLVLLLADEREAPPQTHDIDPDLLTLPGDVQVYLGNHNIDAAAAIPTDLRVCDIAVMMLRHTGLGMKLFGRHQPEHAEVTGDRATRDALRARVQTQAHRAWRAAAAAATLPPDLPMAGAQPQGDAESLF